MHSTLLPGIVQVQMAHLSDGERATEKTIVAALAKLTGMFGSVPRQELRRAVHKEFVRWRKVNSTP